MIWWLVLAASTVAVWFAAELGDATPVRSIDDESHRTATTANEISTAHATNAQESSFSLRLAERFPALKPSFAIIAPLTPSTWALNGREITGLQSHTAASVPGQIAELPLLARHPIPAPAAALTMFFAHSYAEGCAIRANGMEVWARPVHGSPAEATDDHGRLLYRNAYHHTDVIHTIAARRSEEFIHLADHSAPTTFEYVLENSVGALRIVSMDNGGLRLNDDTGNHLTIEAPWVVDATGHKTADATRWHILPDRRDGTQRVALHLDPAGLAYPLVIDPTWNTTGSLATTVRHRHASTLLPTGKILVTGGIGASAPLSSCELYDPATGSCSATGSLTTTRYHHTTTLLPSGLVLVAGGYGNSGYLSSCELYDPTTGVWSATGSLTVARFLHTSTVLISGQILVAGGNNNGSSLSECELYDPVAGTWSTTTSMSFERAAHTSTTLLSGKVLMTGGSWRRHDQWRDLRS